MVSETHHVQKYAKSRYMPTEVNHHHEFIDFNTAWQDSQNSVGQHQPASTLSSIQTAEIKPQKQKLEMCPHDILCTPGKQALLDVRASADISVSQCQWHYCWPWTTGRLCSQRALLQKGSHSIGFNIKIKEAESHWVNLPLNNCHRNNSSIK